MSNFHVYSTGDPWSQNGEESEMDPSELAMLGIDPNDFAGFGAQ